jgi:hypothetical protein
MNTRSIALLACLVFAVYQGWSQQATIFPFMYSMTSARMAGLAGSTVAMVNDGQNVVMNPAGLATLTESSVGGTFIKHVLDIGAGYASYNREVEGLGTMAATVSYNSYGSFDRANVQGTVTGSFQSSDVVLGVSLARELDTLISYGVTAKVLHSSLDNMASTALAVDAGMLFQFPKQRTNIGISIMNLGMQLSTYDGTRDRMPLDLRIGVNHRLRGLPLLVNASLNHLTDEVGSLVDRLLNFSVGGELYLGKVVQARIGYTNAVRNTSAVNVPGQLTGLTGGLGIHLPKLDFDYALSSLGAASVVHRVSVAMRLDD